MDFETVLIYIEKAYPYLRPVLFGFSIMLLAYAGMQLVFVFLDPIFAILNHIQYVLQRPHRIFLKKKRPSKRWLYCLLKPFRTIIWLYVYVLCIPLRFVNALYYNAYVYNIWIVRDALLDLIRPKHDKYATMGIIKYCFALLFAFPFRLIAALFKIVSALVESLFMIVVDLVFPTLTMYHGTGYCSAVNITRPGKWQAGAGNWAGTGLYFGIRRHVAWHYAGCREDSVIIATRVTLARNFPLACAPEEIQKAVCYDGNKISQWGNRRFLASIEHWRDDRKWWEYCILRKHHYPTKTWRVRPLYVIDRKSIFPRRIPGIRSSWFYTPSSIGILLLSVFIIASSLFASTETELGRLFIGSLVLLFDFLSEMRSQALSLL